VDATTSDVEVLIMRQGRRYGLSAAQRNEPGTELCRRPEKARQRLHSTVNRGFGCDSALYRLNLPAEMPDCVCGSRTNLNLEVFHFVVVNDGVLSQLTVEFWANRVATSGTTHIEETIHDPEIHIDHDLAVVWAPLKFYIDGKLDHCGRDLFSLNQKNGNCQIVGLADTTRTDCAAKSRICAGGMWTC
jgi:hypothetical protein